MVTTGHCQSDPLMCCAIAAFSFEQLSLFPPGILLYAGAVHEPLRLSCGLQLQNEQGSCMTAAPDLIFPLPLCWEEVKVNSCWMPKFNQWLIRPLLMDPLQWVMIPPNTAIIVYNVCHLSMKMCVCDPSVWHRWLWLFSYSYPQRKQQRFCF